MFMPCGETRPRASRRCWRIVPVVGSLAMGITKLSVIVILDVTPPVGRISIGGPAPEQCLLTLA